MKEYTVKEIAGFLNLPYDGDGSKIIKRVSSITSSDNTSLIFVDNENIEVKEYGCVITRKEISEKKGFSPVIFSSNPKFDFARFLSLIEKEKFKIKKNYISPNSKISPKAKVSETAYIGDFVTIEDDVCIEENVIVENGVYIGRSSYIGDNTIIFPNTVIIDNTYIGKNCRIGAGCIIGGDGFGYVNNGDVNLKIPQLGRVVIEDEVELGSCVCIDRAALDETIIGKGTKIDNLVHIAHNVKIGKNCLILAQAAIAGSTVIEDNVIIAGQAGVTDHVKIKKGAIIMAQSGVIGNIEEGEVVFGTPARKRGEFMRIQAALSKLPEIYRYFVRKIKDEEK